jgi:hypothetical protein
MVAIVAPSFLDDRRDLRDFLRHAADRLLGKNSVGAGSLVTN